MRCRDPHFEATLWSACRHVADRCTVVTDGDDRAGCDSPWGTESLLSGFRPGVRLSTASRAASFWPCSDPEVSDVRTIRLCILERAGWQPVFCDLSREAAFSSSTPAASGATTVSLASPDDDFRQAKVRVQKHSPVGASASAGLVASLSRLRTCSQRDARRPSSLAGPSPFNNLPETRPALWEWEFCPSSARPATAHARSP